MCRYSTYLLFYVAEDLCEVSGVLAIVTLGASFVWYGKTRVSPEVQHRYGPGRHVLARSYFFQLGPYTPPRCRAQRAFLGLPCILPLTWALFPRNSMHEFWNVLAYFGETIVFVLAGAIMAQRVGFKRFSGADYGNLILLYLVLMLIR